jgi:hypothetical protein
MAPRRCLEGAVYLTNVGTSPTLGEALRLEVAPCS